MQQPVQMADYNIPNEFENGNTPLHKAVLLGNLNMVDHLVDQSNIDIDYKNQLGQTSLHVALLCSSVNIAQKLIEKGADVNASNLTGRTALHYAVERGNLEAVCVLLYYGVDVSILCNTNVSALMLALSNNRTDVAEVLLKYYDDFSDVDMYGFTALHWAVWQESAMTSQLIEAGADVNCMSYYYSILVISLRCHSAEFFKLIWPKFNHHLLLEGTTPFIKQFICETRGFSASDWVECMYLILESPVAFNLLNQWNGFSSIDNHVPLHLGCSSRLLSRLLTLEVEPSDRIGIIASCLSLGWQADEDAVNHAFIFYGCGPELELFIYSMDVYDRLRSSSALNIVPLYIFALDGELGSKNIITLLHRQMRERNMDEQSVTESMLHAFRFLVLPFDERQQLQLLYNHYFPHGTCNLLNSTPKFPSLLELARNKTRQCIRQRYTNYRPYHMHDAVKSLDLPQRVRDIIVFKAPIYN